MFNKNKRAKSSLFVLVVSFILAVSFGLASAEVSIDSVVSDDSWIESLNPNFTGNDDSAVLNVRFEDSGNSSADDIKKSFIRFDLDPVLLNASSVNSATLRLFMSGAPNTERNHLIKKVLSGWDEGSLSWDHQPNVAGNATDSVALTADADNTFVDFDVTSDVEAILFDSFSNFGWMIEDEGLSDSERNVNYKSSDSSNDSLMPMLLIDYNMGDDGNETNVTDVIDVTDLLALLAGWGVCGEEFNNTDACDVYDYNNDGEISRLDL